MSCSLSRATVRENIFDRKRAMLAACRRAWFLDAGADMQKSSIGILAVAAAAIFFCGAAAYDPPPEWAYPLNAKMPEAPKPSTAKLSIPGSHVAVTSVRDFFNPPDWFPDAHPKMPDVVAHGRKPGVSACSFCHMANGQGRPENASLAGQPVAYIIEQVNEIREGRRRSAQPKMVAPEKMLAVAKAVSPSDLKAAAVYFSALKYRSRIRVVESATVPKTAVGGVSLWMALPGNAREPIGERIVEVPEDFTLTELRDPESGFVAYVPPGSIKRGQALTHQSNGALPCTTCHGPDFKGAIGPALAGRSPSYLFRQLFDIKAGTRNGPTVAQMQPKVAHLSNADMIAIVAYLASLKT